ncbi:MAG: hypothetical protein WBF90_22530 [Rivularia sp. (in: cyanobacteria)]
MPILIVLILTFIVAVSVSFFRQRQLNYRLYGRIALAAMFLFAGVSHFVFDDGMIKMLPEFIPLRYLIVYLTGLIEIAFAFGFLQSKYSRLTGILAIAFLICVFPANIYAAINSVEFGGNVNGVKYLPCSRTSPTIFNWVDLVGIG